MTCYAITVNKTVKYNFNCKQDLEVQSTPDNSNLQGKSKKGLSYREFEENSREYSKKQFLLHSEHFNHI